MASMGKFTFFLLFLLSFSSIQIQARKSNFFSKFMHYSGPESSHASVGEAVHKYFSHKTGLFSRSRETPTPTTTTSTVNGAADEDENELLNQEVDSYNNNNGYQNKNYNNNGFETERRGMMSNTRFLQNGKYYYDLNNENNNYAPSEYESEMTKTKNRNKFNAKKVHGNRKEEHQESQNESALP